MANQESERRDCDERNCLQKSPRKISLLLMSIVRSLVVVKESL